jgi:hypothetical protein
MVWGAYVLDADDEGTWLFTPATTPYRAEQDGVVLSQGQFGEVAAETVHYCPRGGWWFARWDSRTVFYIDLACPTEEVAGELRFSDLYLDLYQVGEKALVLDDEDEFAEAWEAGVLTEEEREMALTTRQALLLAIDTKRKPFDGSAWAVLDQARAMQLPPLTELPPLL